jgi:hypothetical protein
MLHVHEKQAVLSTMYELFRKDIICLTSRYDQVNLFSLPRAVCSASV